MTEHFADQRSKKAQNLRGLLVLLERHQEIFSRAGYWVR